MRVSDRVGTTWSGVCCFFNWSVHCFLVGLGTAWVYCDWNVGPPIGAERVVFTSLTDPLLLPCAILMPLIVDRCYIDSTDDLVITVHRSKL